ncbi:MAG: RNA polymerase sporulation sigma factor SigK [Clostridia bacterium]|nr:RNA polymerase sporulation sigma factor SigK [Clostridia bacterium]
MFTLIIAALAKLLSPILGIGTPQSFPPALSSEEERRCFLLMRGVGGSAAERERAEEARQTLILHNLRLVAHIVRKYYSASKDQDDLVSIGTIGLVKAVDTFNVDMGARFATYAAKCIQNEILMSFRAQKKHSSEVSINETIDVDRDGNPLSYMDVISSDEDLPEEVDRKIMSARALHCVKSALTERERQIIILRYGLFGMRELTQREIAAKLGISRSYVSRIEKSALEKLKSTLGG